MLEGTMRGTGGLRIADADCSTGVPGLFAAGDAATRELICGGFTGGGSHNSARALSSGTWAGRAAARSAGPPRVCTGGRRRIGRDRPAPARSCHECAREPYGSAMQS